MLYYALLTEGRRIYLQRMPDIGSVTRGLAAVGILEDRVPGFFSSLEFRGNHTHNTQ